ncbi:hypothetical protein [Asticcacaulis sp. AND118]|uniref:hypothetical protein n=1 Tax=Asticcacaulis sp. AND118 TaxID=2840468 RepID=UPI001CFFF356|nr:hypothetical protein [Asticcacaulis sp. AND118]UDF04864.1 hypothetical protein LH365_15795 [Asticcacaulis sp. AND118]
MLGFVLPARYRLPAFVVLLLLLIAGIIYGMNTGVFTQNNRDALRLEREAATAR